MSRRSGAGRNVRSFLRHTHSTNPLAENSFGRVKRLDTSPTKLWPGLSKSPGLLVIFEVLSYVPVSTHGLAWYWMTCADEYGLLFNRPTRVVSAVLKASKHLVQGTPGPSNIKMVSIDISLKRIGLTADVETFHGRALCMN